jgi:hypothetical protein
MIPLKSTAIFQTLLLLSAWIAASAQTDGPGDRPGSIRSATEAAVKDVAGTLEEAAEKSLPVTSALEKIKLDPATAFELLDIVDSYAIDKGNYVASIELSNPLKPSFSGKRASSDGGKFLFGLRKPYYRLDETIRIIGSFDLSAAGKLAGLGNSAILTFRYDLRGDIDRQALNISMLVDRISYRITIPFGE